MTKEVSIKSGEVHILRIVEEGLRHDVMLCLFIIDNIDPAIRQLIDTRIGIRHDYR